ncbi:hypothetical protein CY34DRAFT_94737 [Suillus luteus UH-Slu-Lm8-n1]|uniref:Unplaced genomic scaffold CY34scaffold_416, whole genome shotgun sequence n=1 Tax=Suillus luteus UH-Slu-Lm8-n1 TaxID=930992 RepID=A0A0D0ADM1_9AGAM|nr:hypothetical protein CY34DRAFT_94737 [Suillus luteus UH-Slu-Lm8-n1]
MSVTPITSSILIDFEIETDPSITYPTLEAFMGQLNNDEPARQWPELFLTPLKRMGVRTLDDIIDMCIVSPKSLHIFYNLCPMMIMDFYVHVIDTINALPQPERV